MKLLTVVTLSASLFLFAACKKSTSTPASNPSDQSITFSANGNPVVVTKISVDTSRAFQYPILVVNGMAAIAATKDTLTFELQFFNSNNSLVSVSQFTGMWDDTTHIHHGSNLTLSSQINYNAYQDAGNGFNDFTAMITANDGKTMTGTFSGSLVTIANNNGAPATLPITNGTFKIDLPGK